MNDAKTAGMTGKQREAYDRREKALQEFGHKHEVVVHAQMELESAERELHDAEKNLAAELGIGVQRTQRLP